MSHCQTNFSTKKNKLLYVFGVSFTLLLKIQSITLAQIIPDNTLGNENSILTQNVDIKDDLAYLIERGALRDANLFHSFLEFNVGEGQRVFFANPEGVFNIFSRITGGNPSEILGTLGVNGDANLFLINPNGIIFGENASLDVNGSFFASTAESIIFADGIQFSTKDTQTKPLLTVSIPIGLGLGETPGSIDNRSGSIDNSSSAGLQVQPGNTLALVGGEVSLEGGILTAEEGRIEIGSVAGNNLVSLTLIEQGWTLNYEGVENFQDINLSEVAVVNTRGDRGSDIQIQGRNITVTSSQISSFSSSESDGRGGNINIRASESVNLVGVIEIQDTLFPSGILSQAITSNGGNITIETAKLTARDGAIVEASTFGTGDAGNLTVITSDSVELIGTAGKADFLSGLFAQVAKQAPEDAGNAGNLTIKTGKLIIQDGAQIANTARFSGNGRKLKINASEFISLNGTAPDATPLKGSSGIFVSADPVENESGSLISPIGNAGELNITTGTLTVEDGAKISADNFGTGKGGNATLNINRLSIRDGGLVRAGSFGEGGGGTLTVNATESVEVTGTGTIGDTPVNSTLFTQAEGTGDAGKLNINTPTLTVKDGGEINASTLDAGKGGELDITAQQLTVSNGGTITARTSGTGKAGNIILKIADNVTLSGTDSGLFANTEEGSTEDGGSILTKEQIPETVIVRDGATIAVNSDGSGKGGSIELTAENLTLNKGSITAETASNKGGNITLNVGNTLSFENSGKITATAGTAQGPGNGGNITINADFILAFPTDNTYEITAKASKGNGGNIEITTKGFFGAEFVDISASSEEGLEGVVTIDVSEIEPARGLTKLPSNIVDASRLIAKSCLAGGEENEFVVTGRGGLPANPNESLRGDAVLPAEWVSLPQEEEEERVNQRKQSANPSTTQEIVEARGWIIGANGNVILTAEPTPVATLEIPWLIPYSCTP